MSAATPTPGTYDLDLAHTHVGFSVRHLMVSKVRGSFAKFNGTIVVAEDPTQSTVEATIDASSIATGDPNRDGHLKSADFFEVERYPDFTFKSTSVKASGDDYVVTGDLTIHGVTNSVDLALEFNGASNDPQFGSRIGFTASTEISRKDYGVDINMPMDGGGVVVGDKVKIELDVEAVAQVPAAA
jgi:polyisoprenoid-binding protein YceI